MNLDHRFQTAAQLLHSSPDGSKSGQHENPGYVRFAKPRRTKDSDSSGETMMDLAGQQLYQLLAPNGGMGLAQMIVKGLRTEVTNHEDRFEPLNLTQSLQQTAPANPEVVKGKGHQQQRAAGDEVQIPDLARQLAAQASAADPARLTRLQAAFEAGSYNVSPDQIAASVIREVTNRERDVLTGEGDRAHVSGELADRAGVLNLAALCGETAAFLW